MDEQTINNIYQAYQSGVMSPQEAADYEADVKAGKMQLPQGASLASPQSVPATSPAAGEVSPLASQMEPGTDIATPTPVTTGAPLLNSGIIEAYNSGAMTREDKMQLEQDVAEGKWQLPEGVQLGTTEPLGFFGRVKEMFTGEERTTSEIEQMPQWTGMPEMNSFSMASFKSALGTMITNPEETVQILKANFPGIEVRRDTKGNFIVKSSIDGQDYAIHPGMTVGDIPRVGGGIAAFTPAGRATTLTGQVVGAGATQAAIEASQAGTGGEFNAEQVPIAGLAGGAGYVVGKGLQAGASQLGRAYERFFRQAPKPATAPRVEPTIAMQADELAGTARQAAEGGIGSSQAKQVLAEQAMPDQKVVEAAKRLGVDEFLQPDHVSTNQAYRELAQAVKSVPGSVTRASELQGLEQVAKRADNLIDELGGLQDLSQLDKTVKSRLMTIQSQLDDQAENLYGQLKQAIDPKTPAPAENMVSWIKSRADDLGGEQFLSPMERRLLKQLSPEANPTYARLDDIRKSLTAARVKGEGVFKDADSGLIKQLERRLLDDQKAVAESAGMLDVFNAARQSVAVRKGVEDDMKALFGKHLQGTMIGDLSGSVKKLAAGDVSKFIQLVKAVPEDMRKEVVASGLNTAFGKTARNGQLSFTNYAKWYEGLLQNKQAYNALMANLPAGSRKRLSDLYRVSNGIRKATRERITTGRIQAVREELRGADTLLGNIYDVAKRSMGGAAAEAVTTPLGLPGAGMAAGISSALTKGRTDTLKAADQLISSPEFIQMASEGTEAAAKRFTNTPAWKRFFKAMGEPTELSNPEQWVLGAFQSQRQMQQENQ